MKYCFLVELRGASADVVLAALANVPGCYIEASRAPALEMQTVIVLFVESELDENAAFEAVANALPVGATIHRTFSANNPSVANKPKM